MQTSLQSAAALRALICDFSTEMRAINSTKLPNGATAFDAQTQTLWRLNKNVGTVFDALIDSGLVLKPNDNTPGRWFRQSLFPDSLLPGRADKPRGPARKNQWTPSGQR